VTTRAPETSAHNQAIADTRLLAGIGMVDDDWCSGPGRRNACPGAQGVSVVATLNQERMIRRGFTPNHVDDEKDADREHPHHHQHCRGLVAAY
jgi:hypothetical protein